MALKTKRALIKLGANLSLTLPKQWTRYWKMKKGDKILLLGDDILIVVPADHPQQEKLESRIRRFLTQ